MAPTNPIVLAAYDPAWPRLAESYGAQLRVLGDCLIAVHHIGSTSVVGLAAKPTIDLMPVVTRLAALEVQRPKLEALGYQWRGEFGIAGRRLCVMDNEAGLRLANVHLFAAGAPDIDRALAFRDYLRIFPGAAQEYERQKREACRHHPHDMRAYTDAKGPWIRETETKALAWRAQQRTVLPA